MSILNAGMRGLVGLLMRPLAGLPAFVSLCVFALAASVVMLVVFKHTSNQARLSEVKRRIHASLFEIRLFSDDIGAIFRAQLDVLRHNARYLGLSLVPMVWILVPLTLLIAQLQFHYGYAGFEPGQTALVKLDLAPDAVPAVGRPEVSLEAPAGVRVDGPGVWIPSQRQVAWRVVAERAGDYELRIRRAGAEPVVKDFRVGAGAVARRSPLRHDGGWLDSVLYPAEGPIPKSAGLRAIHVSYPEAEVSVLGWGFQWMIPFFALSIAFAFALRGPFNVTI